MALHKERIHSDEEITEVISDAWACVTAAEIPAALHEPAFAIALQLRSQVAVSAGPVIQAGSIIQ